MPEHPPHGGSQPTGTPLLVEYRGRVGTPQPGRAVLACRCGRMLALGDMYRPVRRLPRSAGVVEPICCERCATDSAL